MDDKMIVDLYFDRDEKAIEATEEKYGKYCFTVAFNILNSEEDSKECVNDTYINAWNSIPPHRPEVLRTFLGKITRNISLNRYESNRAAKRFCGADLAYEELEEYIPDGIEVADEVVLKDTLERFLESLKERERIIFLRRYWYFCSIREISLSLKMSEGNVKVILLRAREKLLKFLEQEKG